MFFCLFFYFSKFVSYFLQLFAFFSDSDLARAKLMGGLSTFSQYDTIHFKQLDALQIVDYFVICTFSDHRLCSLTHNRSTEYSVVNN